MKFHIMILIIVSCIVFDSINSRKVKKTISTGKVNIKEKDIESWETGYTINAKYEVETKNDKKKEKGSVKIKFFPKNIVSTPTKDDNIGIVMEILNFPENLKDFFKKSELTNLWIMPYLLIEEVEISEEKGQIELNVDEKNFKSELKFILDIPTKNKSNIFKKLFSKISYPDETQISSIFDAISKNQNKYEVFKENIKKLKRIANNYFEEIKKKTSVEYKNNLENKIEKIKQRINEINNEIKNVDKETVDRTSEYNKEKENLKSQEEKIYNPIREEIKKKENTYNETIKKIYSLTDEESKLFKNEMITDNFLNEIKEPIRQIKEDLGNSISYSTKELLNENEFSKNKFDTEKLVEAINSFAPILDKSELIELGYTPDQLKKKRKAKK